MDKVISRIVAMVLLAVFALPAPAQRNPKREFRGAWMHTIGQSQYARQSTEENKAYLRDQLDRLQQAGVNAVIFQVRPSADAFYESHYEMWSRYLVPQRKAPVPYWDPLQFMVDEAHARGMELHAWLNPYRATTAKDEKLPPEHIINREPWRFVKYEGDGKIYFDPALPENREFIAKVVADIVSRYDVDAIHFDDYFYPYPANGKPFPDDKSYAKYGGGADRGDWRRANVDKLIEQVHDTINDIKPWVRFGISPFGIWRNKKSDPRGSDTAGLENYDALYADVLLWAERGWIDYLVPQLYWELEHPKASYMVLVDWWARAVPEGSHLYIGQDVVRTMTKPDVAPSKLPTQLDHKVEMVRERPAIGGNCWWPAYTITADAHGAATAIKAGPQSTLAIVPAYTHISPDAPDSVTGLRLQGSELTWRAPIPYDPEEADATDVVKYVVYRFDADAPRDFDDARNIVAITPYTRYKAEHPGVYVVTALDRVNNESSPSAEISVP